MATVPQGLTLEEFLDLPEEKPALEFEEGGVTQKVSPQGPHSVLQGVAIERINAFARRRKLALAFPELRITYAGRSYVPDVSVFRWQRIPRTSRGTVVQRFVEPPDIVIEIISPGQTRRALLSRCAWYVANGVQVALLLDPDDETVTVVRPNAMPVVLRGSEPIGLDEVIEGLDLTPADLFASLRLD